MVYRVGPALVTDQLRGTFGKSPVLLCGSPPTVWVAAGPRAVTFLDLIVLSLAVFRISRLIIEDTITQPLRDWLLGNWPGKDVEYEIGDDVRGGTFELDGNLYATSPTWVGDRIAKLISCYWCTGFWISLVLAVAYYLWPIGTGWVALPFALSAVAGIVGVLMHEAVDDE